MSDSSPKQIPPFGLRMPPDLKARVQAAAEGHNRSMNAEIIATLEEKYPPPKVLDATFKRLATILEAMGLRPGETVAEENVANYKRALVVLFHEIGIPDEFPRDEIVRVMRERFGLLLPLEPEDLRSGAGRG